MVKMARILAISLVISSIGISNAEWIEQNSGVIGDFQAIHFPSPDTGYVGGPEGQIIRTYNGGQTWEKVTNTGGYSGYSSVMKFITNDVGYIHGWGQIYKTTNAGASWQSFANAPQFHYFAFDAWDNDHMATAGQKRDTPYDCFVTKTGASGFHSILLPNSTSGTQYNDLQCLSQTHIKALQFSGISTSTDAGDNWTFRSKSESYAGSENIGWNGFHFPSQDVGYIAATDYNAEAGKNGFILKTTDGGTNWQKSTSGFPRVDEMFFLDDDYGFAIGRSGFIYKTLDGGDNWFGTKVGNDDINGISFVDKNIGYIVTNTGKIYKTTDGGMEVPKDYNMALLAVDLPASINTDDAPFEIAYEIRNDGIIAVTKYKIYYQIDNEQPLLQQVVLNDPLPNAVSTKSFHGDLWAPSEGTYNLKFWVSDPEDNADQNTGNDTLEKTITVFSGSVKNRIAIIEDATGAWCGYCPGAALEVEGILETVNTGNSRQAIAVALHSGDAMEIDGGKEIITNYAAGAFPSLWVDRHKFFDENTVKIVNGTVTERTNERLNVIAPVNIGIAVDYNESNREVTVTVEAGFISDISDDLRYNCYILEDSILSSQSNAYNSVSGHPLEGLGNPIPNYVNDHVLRAIVGSTWGDKHNLPDDIKKDDSFSHEFKYTVPGNFNDKKVSVVAFISQYDSDNTKREILNANIRYLLGDPVDIDIPSELVKHQGINQIRISPNPFRGMTSIQFDLHENSKVILTIVNSKGKTVYTRKGYKTKGSNTVSFDGSCLPSGIYFVNIAIGKYNYTKKIVCSK